MLLVELGKRLWRTGAGGGELGPQLLVECLPRRLLPDWIESGQAEGLLRRVVDEVRGLRDEATLEDRARWSAAAATPPTPCAGKSCQRSTDYVATISTCSRRPRTRHRDQR